jgi:hypothetical protein
MGMAAGPIPWHVIDQYATRYGITGDEFEDLVQLVGVVDQAWLENANAKK